MKDKLLSQLIKKWIYSKTHVHSSMLYIVLIVTTQLISIVKVKFDICTQGYVA